MSPASAITLSSSAQPALFTGIAGGGLAWRAIGGAGKRLVAPAAAAAAGDNDLFTFLGQIAQDVAAVAVGDEGARAGQ